MGNTPSSATAKLCVEPLVRRRFVRRPSYASPLSQCVLRRFAVRRWIRHGRVAPRLRASLRRGRTRCTQRCVLLPCDSQLPMQLTVTIRRPGFPALPGRECGSTSYQVMMDDIDRMFSSLPSWQPPDNLCAPLILALYQSMRPNHSPPVCAQVTWRMVLMLPARWYSATRALRWRIQDVLHAQNLSSKTPLASASGRSAPQRASQQRLASGVR